MNKIIEYYNNIYNENERLGQNCDNRHLTEKMVKQRIINQYFSKGDVVLEIGAGTGIHSIFLSKEGCNVSACDIIPNHVKLIEENARANNVQINASVQDALNLDYENSVFDLVLLSGPVYHMHSYNDKEQAIKEAKRVCKKNGIIIIDFLPKLHSFIQQVLRYPDFIENLNNDDIENLECKDDIFSFDNKEDIIKLVEKCNLKVLDIISTDSITRFIRDKINELDEENLEKWIKIVEKINKYNVVDLGEHALIIVQNKGSDKNE